MSLNFTREVIGRAVLDHSFRQSLLTDPGKALRGYHLSGPEKQALQHITPQQFQALEDFLQGSIGGAGNDAAAKIFLKFEGLAGGGGGAGSEHFLKLDGLAGHKQLGDFIGYKELSDGFTVKLMGDGLVIKWFQGFLDKDDVLKKFFGDEFPKVLMGSQRNRRSRGWLLPAVLVLLLFSFFGFLFFGPPMTVLGMFGLFGVNSFGDGSVIPACSPNPGPPDMNPGPPQSQPGPPNMTLPQQLLFGVNSFRMGLGAQPLMCKSGPDPEAGSGGTCGDQCSAGEWCVASGGPGQCAIYCVDSNYDGTCESYRCLDADGNGVCDLISWTTCSATGPGVLCSTGDPQGTCSAGLTCSPDAAGYFTCQGEVCAPATTEGGTPTAGGHCMDQCDPNDPNSCLAGLKCVPRSSAAASGYICYNEQICNPNVTQEPNVTEQPGGGPTDPCAKESCGDGYCSSCPVDAQCTSDCPPANPCDKSCGNGVCEANCRETANTCPADCVVGVP